MGLTETPNSKICWPQKMQVIHLCLLRFPGFFSGQNTWISDCPAQNWTPGNHLSELDKEHRFKYTHLDFLNASSSSFVSSKSFAALSQTPAFVLAQRVFFLGSGTGFIDCAWACAFALTTSSCFRESSAFKLISWKDKKKSCIVNVILKSNRSVEGLGGEKGVGWLNYLYHTCTIWRESITFFILCRNAIE